MTTPETRPIQVRDEDGHVVVDGLDSAEVEAAIALYRSAETLRTGARSSLAAHVSSVMLEQEIPLVSTASQRQVQRSAELRRRLLEEHGVETYASLAVLRGGRESSARTWVSRMRPQGLITVEVQGRTLIPSAQLTEHGDIAPLLREILQVLSHSTADGWSRWAWLVGPTALLSGQAPVDVTATDHARALRAAQRYAAQTSDRDTR